jgi:hypothetical protein
MANQKIRVRGVRQVAPTAVVVGRTDPGNGPVQFIKLADLGTALVQAGGTLSNAIATGGAGGGGTAATPTFEFLGFYGQGTFDAHAVFPMAIAPINVRFPSATAPITRNFATAGVPPNGNTSFVLCYNSAAYLSTGASVICTVSFAAGAANGTFAYGTPYTVSAGQIIYIVMNSSSDATFAQVQAVFCGDPA